MTDSILINQTAVVRILLENGDIGFDGLAAVYKFDTRSDQIREVLAASKRTGREVKFANDRGCHIHSAELAPARQTPIGQFVQKVKSAFSRRTTS